jgi:hypothetical protein
LTYQKSKNDLELKKIQADINATNALATQRNTPGAKPTQTQRTNQSMSEDYNSLKNMPVNNAVDELLSGRADYIAAYGISGFKQLWDTVLADAIRAGQAKPYSEYFKDQSLEY